MQDGTKIQALASTKSYPQEEPIREHLARARRLVTEMGDPHNEDTPSRTKRGRERHDASNKNGWKAHYRSWRS